MNKQNLLVSFSGGETSAYMAQWLWKNKQDKYNMVFVFANTGQESVETLNFIKRCELYFGFNVHYIESVIHHGLRKGSTHREVIFEGLDIDGRVFEEMIKKYGIPNKAYPHCTRELKLQPIKSFAKEYFNNEPYLCAVGIREDEMDRINAKHKEMGIIYHLITMRPMTKQKINFWWSKQSFRLELKGYQGNCITCWKKSDKKLYQIAKEDEGSFNFFRNMEHKYKEFIPKPRVKIAESKGEQIKKPIVFFRRNRSVQDILNESLSSNTIVHDDHLDFDESESCDIYSGCAED